MKNKYKKRYIALLEVLIAMGLTVLILSSLLFFYRQVMLINTLTDRTQQETFRLSYLQNRLNEVLAKAYLPGKKNDVLFYTASDFSGSLSKEGSKSLIFSYDNGIDLDKLFSNRVIARLFLDPQGNLTLITWPTPIRWPQDSMLPAKREVLMENASNLWFEFFVPPDKDRSKVVKKNGNSKPEIEPLVKGGWIRDWRDEYYALPLIVKVHITKNAPAGDGKQPEELTFSYPLMNSEGIILYNQ